MSGRGCCRFWKTQSKLIEGENPADTCFGRDSKTVRHWCGIYVRRPGESTSFSPWGSRSPAPRCYSLPSIISPEEVPRCVRAACGAGRGRRICAGSRWRHKGPLRLVGDFDLVAESVGTGEQPLEFQVVDDPLHVREVERAEDDDVVDAVQELRCEGFFQRPAVFRLRGLSAGCPISNRCCTRPAWSVHCRGPRSDVGGENDYRISEIDLAPRTVGEVSLVEDLQQGVEDFGWAFDFGRTGRDRIGMAAYRFGELSAFAVADISRRGSRSTVRRCVFAVFAHVDTDESLCSRRRAI